MTFPPLVFIAIVVAVLTRDRLNEIFFVSIRSGRLLVVRGRIPSSLLERFADIARDAEVARATIRAVKDVDHARLVIRGIGDPVAQRLRNVFGTHPLHELRSAPPPDDRNLGQMIGWTWLAWTLLR